MRILMVNHEFTITGSSTAFLRLAAHLQGQGHQVSVLPVNPADGPIKTRYAQLGVPIVEQAVLSEFDLAIANTICSAGVVLRIPAALPTIWMINEAEVALNILLRNTSLLPAFERAAAIIYYNMPFQHDVFRSFTYQLDAAKFHTASLGVDLDLTMIARNKVPPKSRRFRAVQVGTIEPRKRPGDFVRAVAKSGLDMECVICGKYFEIDETAKKIVAAEPDKYRLLEGLSDGEVMAWVESADMFCLVSGSETQGLSVYEAALQAKALLLSDLPCYRDIFIHGRNALLFPPGHIELLSLSMQMLAASEQLRNELATDRAALYECRVFQAVRCDYGFGYGRAWGGEEEK
jgi:glycosyltransferase involved in cell wall biosynthesis